MTDYILDINTLPDCQRLKDYYLDIYGVNLDIDSSYLNPGYIWIYYIIANPTYYGETIYEKYLYLFYELNSIVDKNSYVVLTTDVYDTLTEYYGEIYTSTGSLIYREYLTSLYIDEGTITDFDYMICGCGDNAILCGECCIYCCKIAEATKEYYEKILQ